MTWYKFQVYILSTLKTMRTILHTKILLTNFPPYVIGGNVCVICVGSFKSIGKLLRPLGSAVPIFWEIWCKFYFDKIFKKKKKNHFSCHLRAGEVKNWFYMHHTRHSRVVIGFLQKAKNQQQKHSFLKKIQRINALFK